MAPSSSILGMVKFKLCAVMTSQIPWTPDASNQTPNLTSSSAETPDICVVSQISKQMGSLHAPALSVCSGFRKIYLSFLRHLTRGTRGV